MGEKDPTLAERGSAIPRDYRVNRQIRAAEVRVVDEKNQQLGIMPLRTALQLAEERGLDLVEVAPQANPPVCRLLDYGKFRYEVARREREARKAQRQRAASQELREVRFKTRIGEHDRSAKTRQVRRLLNEGAKVKVSVVFRGREITHPEIGMEVLKAVARDLVDDAVLDRPPAMEGNALTMVLAPIPDRVKAARAEEKARLQERGEEDKELKGAKA